MTIQELKQEFIKIFGGTEDELRIFTSPGRVNLIGEHTDYNGGFVFPAALTFSTTVIARKRDDDVIRIKASDLPDIIEGTLDTLDNFRDLKWGNYQFGVFVELKKAGYNLTGADMIFHDTTPHGAGLSSSAAIEVSSAIAMASLGGAKEIDSIEMAKLSQMAEHNYVGVKCGIMDQFASAMGKKNHAIFLDCKTLDYKLIPIVLDGYKLVLSNTNKKHSLGASKYNERRNECEKGFEILKKYIPKATCLGDITPEMYEPYKDKITDEIVEKRVRHVIEEDDRVKKSIDVLVAGDLKAFGELMTASHNSLRDLYEVTCPELDLLAAEALKIDGVLGSRMTGAGFGGCTVSLVKNENVDEFIEKLGKIYLDTIGHKADFYITEIGDGGRELTDIKLKPNKFTMFESEDEDIQMMNGKASYHPLTGVAYFNNKKKMFPRGETVDGVNMAPADFFNFAFGAEVKVDKAKGTISIGNITMTAKSVNMIVSGNTVTVSAAPYIKGDVAYVPICEVGKAFGKNVYILDKSKSATGDIKSNSGAIIMSDSEISFPDGHDILHKLCNFLAFYRPSPTEIQAAYNASPRKGIHPRVLATEEDFERIKKLNETDEYVQKNVKKIIEYADKWCETPTYFHELRDKVRLWYISQEFEREAQELGIAYKLTGNKKYKDKLWASIEAVANFPDWNTQHHIDTGGLALGYGIIYDWLYHDWTEEQREIIIKGAIKNGFSVYIDGLEERNEGMYWGYKMYQNHNCVMTSGGASLAAAFADELPEICSYVQAGMVRVHEYMAQTFAPDGQWFEGSSYGAMTLQYTSHFFAITEQIWGSLYGMDYSEGTPNAADFPLYMQNPKTGNFGFYDGEKKNIVIDSGTLWWANHYDKPYLTKLAISDYMKYKYFNVECRGRLLLWYNPEHMTAEIPDFATDVHYSTIDVITARDSWEDTQAFFAAKGGSAKDIHGHMDATHFIFHSGKTSWEELSGTSDYNIPGWWGYDGTDGKRWQFYLARAEGHNVAIIDPIAEESEYLPEVRISYDIFKTKPRGVIASCDTTALHNKKATSARRGFFFTDDRRSLVVREEFVLDKERDVYTLYHSVNKPEIDGNKVIIKNGMEVLTIEYISNKPLEIVVAENQTMHKNSSIIPRVIDSGYKIYAKVTGKGEVNITAKYTPNLVTNPTPVTDYDMPLTEWEIPNGEIPNHPKGAENSVSDVIIGTNPVAQHHSIRFNENDEPEVQTPERLL